MKVLATVAPQVLWQAQLSQFGLVTAAHAGALAANAAQLLVPSQTPAQLAVLLSQYPELELAISYQAPEHMLGCLLATGHSPEQAAALWQVQTEALLQLQQQQRRRVKLFSLYAASNAEDLTALPAWITLSNEPALSDVSPSSDTLQLASPPAAADSVYTLLAAQLLCQLPELSALQQRLFASSLPLLEHSEYQFNFTSLLGQVSDKTELQKLNAKLEAVSADQKSLSAEHKQTQTERDSLQQQLSAASDERDLLLQQLLHVQEELEQLFTKKTAVKQQYAKLQDTYQSDVKHLTTQLDNGQSKVAATSKQLTSLQVELERIAGAHSDSIQQLAATSGERDLLLQQLMRVQEELEQYYLKWQSAEQKANHADTARDKQQQREIARLESQLRKTKARAAGAEHQQQLLQQQLGAVKNSTLWKTAAPARVLTRLLKKTDKAKQKLQQEAALIITSEYFDIDWYLARNPDVAAGTINPAEHYLRFGASEGRMPGPLFDGDWYLQRYPDVVAGGINPLLHFIKFGQQEGRTASPKLLTDHSVREE